MKFVQFVLMGLTVLAEAVVDGSASGAAVVVDAAAEIAAFIEAETAKLSDALKAAIAEGHLTPERGEVEIGAKASPTKVAASRFYLQLWANDAQGMAVLCNGKLGCVTPRPEGDDTRTEVEKAKGACDYFNYGYDLRINANVRAALMATLEGPEKAIKQSVDNCVKNLGMTEDEARTFVIAQRTKAGLPV